MKNIIIDGKDLVFIDDLGDDNIEIGRLRPNFDLDNISFNIVMTPTNFDYNFFKKWLNGPRKTKKKNFGLAKDKCRLSKKLMRGELMTVKELQRMKLDIKF